MASRLGFILHPASFILLLDDTDPRRRPVDDDGASQHEPLWHKAPHPAVGRRGAVVAEAKVMAWLDVVGLHLTVADFLARVVNVAPERDFRDRNVSGGANTRRLVRVS